MRVTCVVGVLMQGAGGGCRGPAPCAQPVGPRPASGWQPQRQQRTIHEHLGGTCAGVGVEGFQGGSEGCGGTCQELMAQVSKCVDAQGPSNMAWALDAMHKFKVGRAGVTWHC
eukprot:scaffold189826_cov16-Tisochrysis_lutea.AAC.1